MSTLLTRRTVLAARLENPAYTGVALGAAHSNFNIMDVSAQANIEQEQRQAADSFANRASTTGLRSGTFSFKQDLHGDGAGGVPLWASTFLPACGLVDDGTGTFRPKTATPTEGAQGGAGDNGVRTLSLGVFEDGRRKLLTGAMGTAKFMLPTGKNCYVEFTFRGSWNEVVDTPLLIPAYPPQLPFRFAAADLDIGGFEPCLAQMSIDLGNDVQMRECQKNANASGYRGAFIGDRKVGGNLDPEAQLVADFDPFGDWLNSIEKASSVSVADATDRVTFDIPKLQFNNVAEGDRNGLRTDPLTWQANRDAAADDEFSITFGAA